MKMFFAEFKKFITRGNVVDMAVGIIIGGAFGKITTSLVNDVIMPLICSVFNTADVAGLNFLLGATPIYYGKFLAVVLDFFIIAFILFCILKVLNSLDSEVRELKKKNKREMTLKERRVLKKQGFSKIQIIEMERLRAEERLEKDRQALSKVLPQETTDSVLKEIRNLLKEQNKNNINNK